MTPEEMKDSKRAMTACAAIVDGRDVDADLWAIMFTLERVVGALLLSTQNLDARRAVMVLNESLVPRLEEQIASFDSRINAS